MLTTCHDTSQYPTGSPKLDHSQGFALKAANQIVDEIALAVRPPRGVAIVLTERPGETPNWAATAGFMDLVRNEKFVTKVTALRKTNPDVDWSAAAQWTGERRRVAKWLSEISGA